MIDSIPRFETTQISAPPFEDGGLRFITVKTPNLPGRGDIVTFVPEVKEGDLPMALLLHGVYGSAWVWAMRGGAHRTAQRLIKTGKIRPMILAMPSDGLWKDGSFYLPHHGYDFEKWIVEDVPDAVRLLIPEAENSRQICIAGLSMGGFGALRLGGKYPKMFSGISGHSAITDLSQAHHFTKDFIEGVPKMDRSVFATFQHNANVLPPIRFDCGADDLLIEYNRVLHRDLDNAQIPHDYHEFSGAHEWSYWEEHLEQTLLFFEECFSNG